MKIFIFALAMCMSALPALGQERFPPLAPDQMTPDQKDTADQIIASRGNLNGPFQAWLRDPALSDRLQKLGQQIRWHSTLPVVVNEFAILITARHWTAQFEWYAHYPLAMKAGLAPAIADDLAAGQRPRNMPGDLAVAYDFSTQLHASGHVDDATYDAAVKQFGEKGVVDLIAVNGYYDLVSMTLNVAQVGIPGGAAPPLKPLPVN